MSSMYRIKVMRNERQGFDHARMQISIGQEYHEGEKLKAVTVWASRHFKRVSVNLCDELQRYNMVKPGIAPDSLTSQAIALGDDWLQRNGDVIKTLPKLKITRWNDWKQDTAYDRAVKMTALLYKNDDGFKTLIDLKAHYIWEKKNNNRAFQDEIKTHFITASTAYMLEEVAVTQVMSTPDIAEIYPGSFLPAFDYMRNSGLNTPKSMTSLGFARRKQSQVVALNA